ncbi:hypothetical protein KGQ20_39730 [Catenulispora sp. NF23]|uniref:Uridine kinase n=1 Tax=Catenulispora pinistramenti TaxID=2705254 RepID=A0ABS5KYU1_9ACTN|nr:hypothetical protein [Catenulispora pinistramenti]MBS2538895.1 hypothetical protein [Catenulispora pinistramenti]MBS2551236.1 hypothetical protein [Catenulispora pinistramenti]
MLLALTGSSGAGKSTLAFAVADRLSGAVVHDFDEVGVPDPPIPPHWRNEMTEHWIRRALEYQEHGLDLVGAARRRPVGRARSRLLLRLGGLAARARARPPRPARRHRRRQQAADRSGRLPLAPGWADIK